MSRHLRAVYYDAAGMVIRTPGVSTAVLPGYRFRQIGGAARDYATDAPTSQSATTALLHRAAQWIMLSEWKKLDPAFSGVALISCPSQRLVRSAEKKASPEASYYASYAMRSKKGYILSNDLSSRTLPEALGEIGRRIGRIVSPSKRRPATPEREAKGAR